MNIIVHTPATDEDKKEISRKAAILHNQAILHYIRQLSCPDYQKQALLQAIYGENR